MPPPLHNVRSVLQISAVAPKVLFLTESQHSQDQYQRTQIAVVKSRLVLRAALQQPEVANLPQIQAKADPVLWLEKSIKADFLLGPEILSISLSGDDAQVLMAVVNAVAKAYTEVIVGKDHQKQKDRLQELKSAHSHYTQKVQAKQKDLTELAVAAGSRDVQNLFLRQRIVLEDLKEAKKQLATAQAEAKKLAGKTQGQVMERRRLLSTYVPVFYVCPKAGLPVCLALAGLVQYDQARDARLDSAAFLDFQRELMDLPVPDSLILDALNQDAETQSYKKRVHEAEQHLARMKELVDPKEADPLLPRMMEIQKLLADGFGTDHPKVKALKDEMSFINDTNQLRLKRAQHLLANARKEFAEYIDAVRPRIVKAARDKFVGEHSALRLEFDSWKSMEKGLLSEVERLTKQNEFINERTIKLEAMAKEITSDEDMMRKIGTEVEALEVEQRAPARVTQLEQAVLYPGERGSKQLMMVGGMGAGAFGFVLFCFVGFEVRRRVVSSGDVVNGLGIRLMGTVPDINYRTSRRLFRSAAETRARFDSALTSSVDTTRTMLLHAAARQGLKVVLITSAVGGEGKTSLAAHLGPSLARAGRKTLLVDADLRKPTLHRLFHVQRAPGFSELLQGLCSFEEVIRSTDCEGLSLMTAGQTTVQAIEALAHERIASLFQHLRHQYDLIVMDCAPVLPVPDSLLLTQHADAAILAVLRDVSRVPAVYAAYQRLSALGVTILGAVVNGAQEDVYSSYYLQPVMANS
jgi:capsular exopolysaccharide synthesis family protein